MSDDPLAVACRHLANSQTIIERKNAEIEQLKEAIQRLADQDATLSVCDGNVTVTMDATLTAEERQAIERGSFVCDQTGLDKSAATLRNLLERTKDDQNKDAIC
jgi:hypothetical protein